MSRTHVRGAVAVAAVGACAVAGLTVLPSHAAPPPQTATIVITDGRAQVSNPVLAPGWTTFTVRDARTDGADGFGQVFALKNGATLQSLSADLQAAGSPDDGAFTTALANDTELYGGVDVVSGSDSFSENLPAGTYYAINLNDPPKQIPKHAAKFTVSGPATTAKAPTYVGSIVGHTNGHGRMKWDSPSQLPTDAVVRLANRSTDSDDIHFLTLVPVQEGTTDQEVEAYLRSDPDPDSEPPFADDSRPYASSGLLSPGETQLFHYSLPQGGEYLEACFITDPATGQLHLFEGMHHVVELGSSSSG